MRKRGGLKWEICSGKGTIWEISRKSKNVSKIGGDLKQRGKCIMASGGMDAPGYDCLQTMRKRRYGYDCLHTIIRKRRPIDMVTMSADNEKTNNYNGYDCLQRI